ncbi:DUF4249 domain-containing protein [Flavobacterium crassostreae]|uniref:DUF4249 domain-containing protein n=1 Tax=Flavobacterium crassostreae TaxID=1763534 RepID=UPI0008A27226|nr:DUF4249 domain-containing protein [Flavobacterium crassostreae]
MKKTNLIISLLLLLFLSSCEEVVSVDLKPEAPRLVIEAAINWQKGTDGKQQKIKLSTTTSFFSSQIPTVSDAVVVVKNSNGMAFVFKELSNSGEYVCDHFIPVIGQEYSLSVTLNNTVYTATETLQGVAAIDEVTQTNEGGITRDEVQIKTFFKDPLEQDNYYFFRYTYPENFRQDLSVTDDDLFKGNRFFSLSQKEDLKPGDAVKITHYGVSRKYYNYLQILTSIAGGNSGGPFQSPPTTLRGNIVNTTNKEQYPLGFFSVSETDSRTYIIQ